MAPSEEAERVVNALPYGLRDNSNEVIKAMPATHDREALDHMAHYVRSQILIPFDTPFEDAERVLLNQLPARVIHSSTVKKYFTNGQRDVNKRLTQTMFDVRNAVKAVVSVISQFGTVANFAQQMHAGNVNDVVVQASIKMGQNVKNKRAPGYKNLLNKFGGGVKYFEGYRREMQRATNDPQINAIYIVQTQCKTESKRIEEARGGCTAPNPFYIRDNHSDRVVRSSMAVFCIIPMRFDHFRRHFDEDTKIGWRMDSEGNIEAAHAPKVIHDGYHFKGHMLDYTDPETVSDVWAMQGHMTVANHIRRGLTDLYGELFDWTSLRHGWELHMRLNEGYEDDSFKKDELHRRIGHSAKRGRGTYCKMTFATPKMDTVDLSSITDTVPDDIDLSSPLF